VVIKKIKSIFELDLRSLAFFRIVLAIVILGDLVIRLSDFQAFYTDQGIHSRSFIIEDSHQYRISLYHAVGRSEQVIALFLVHISVALCFLFGIKTRVMTFLLWLLTISLQNRNYTILNNGDSLLRCLLLFSVFLPLGARYAIDSLKTKVNSNNTYFSLGNIGLIGQFLVMYIFSGILKDGPQWRMDYSAVDLSLMLDQFTTSFGKWMAQFHTINRFLTWSTIKMEVYLPFLLLLPWWRDQIRLLLITLFTLFHISISAMLRIGIFTPISIAGWMMFIPSQVWDKLESTDLYSRMTNFFLNKTLYYDFSVDKKSISWIGLPLFTLVMYLNIASVEKWRVRTPAWLSSFAQVTRIDQSWGMFAPFPLLDDGWNIVHGKLQNGLDVDLIQNKIGEVSYEKPQDMSIIYPNQRWQKFLTNLRLHDLSESLLEYGQWICRNYNHKKIEGSKLSSFEIIYMEEFSESVGVVRALNKRVLWTHNCFAK